MAAHIAQRVGNAGRFQESFVDAVTPNLSVLRLLLKQLQHLVIASLISQVADGLPRIHKSLHGRGSGVVRVVLCLDGGNGFCLACDDGHGGSGGHTMEEEQQFRRATLG